MRYTILLLISIVLSCQNHTEQKPSPYVVKQGEAVYWAVMPTMDSIAFNKLSNSLLTHSIFFKPVINQDKQGYLTGLSGNMIVFDKSRTKLTDTLLSNRLILPKDRKNWLASQSVDVGHTRATLRMPPLGFWYDPKSGLHTDVVGENFPKSLRDLVEKEFSAKASAALAEQNAKRINNFKAAVAKGEPAFTFTLPDSAGKQISLSNYKGKVVYLDFWAHWCGACIEEMKALKKLPNRLKNHPDLVFLYVSIDDPKDKEKWRTALRKHKFLGTHALADGGYTGPVARAYGINELPTKFVIDRTGKFYERGPNLPYPIEEEKLIALLEKALAEK